MSKKHDIIEETILNKIKLGLQRAFYVYADEGVDASSKDEPVTETDGEEKKEESDTPNFNYEDLISKARKEEKDKLYPKITALEKEKEGLIEKSNKSLLKIGELQAKIDELGNQSTDKTQTENDTISDLKKALAKKEEELKGIVETTEDIQVVEDRVRQSVVAEYEVKLYREQKLREVGDQVIPELVMGDSKEQIDESLKQSQKRFNEIVNKTISGVKVPPANTSVSKLNTKDFSIEDLAKLDPRSEEYRELRTKLGLK